MNNTTDQASGAHGQIDEQAGGPEGDHPAVEELTFEQRAIGDVVNPLEHIDSVFRRTGSRLWWGVAGVFLLVAALVTWGFIAERVVTTDTAIMMLPRTGLYPVGSLETGVIGEVDVEVGSSVSAGQKLATISNPAIGEIEIVAPIDGVVVEVDAVRGQVTSLGASVFLLAPRGEPTFAIGLVSPAQLNGLQKGQKVTIGFPTVNEQSSGRLIGTLDRIGDTPVTSTRIAAVLGSGTLAAAVAQQGPVYEVQIELIPSNTPSGYAWTVGEGPPSAPPITSIGVASIETSRQSIASEIFG